MVEVKVTGLVEEKHLVALEAKQEMMMVRS